MGAGMKQLIVEPFVNWPNPNETVRDPIEKAIDVSKHMETFRKEES
jgi:hypothetical protein